MCVCACMQWPYLEIKNIPTFLQLKYKIVFKGTKRLAESSHKEKSF